MATEYKLSYTAEEINEKLRKIPDSEIATIDQVNNIRSIIDVIELPKTDALTAVYVQNGLRRTDYTCYCVNKLPETGVPVSDGKGAVISYYNTEDGVAYGYLNDAFASMAGVPAGWYTMEVLAPLARVTYGGIITNIIDDPKDDAFRILLEHHIPETIKQDSFYRLLTAEFIRYQRSVSDTWSCYVVENLPKTGETVTDTTMSFIIGYYSIADNEVYGYVDSALGDALGVTNGWYPINLLVGFARFTWKGIITDISDDPCDGSLRVLLKKELYLYDNGWRRFMSDFATVALTGDYNDLLMKPTIYTDVGRYNTTQNISSTSKAQARTNIDVYSKTEVDDKIANAIGSAIGGSY